MDDGRLPYVQLNTGKQLQYSESGDLKNDADEAGTINGSLSSAYEKIIKAPDPNNRSVQISDGDEKTNPGGAIEYKTSSFENSFSKVMEDPIEYDQQRTSIKGLILGRRMVIDGVINKDVKRVRFQLQDGDDPLCNILFKMVICLKERIILCNSFLYESWGALDTHVYEKYFPFKDDSPVVIEIEVTIDCFKVIVRDKCIIDFGHRVHPERSAITHITFDSNFTVHDIVCPKGLEIPHVVKEPIGFRPGHALQFDMKPSAFARRFEVKVESDGSNKRCCFILEVSFKGDIVEVVCYTYQNEKKGEETRIDGHLPIRREQNLEFKMILHEKMFEILLDGGYFVEHDHNLILKKMTKATVSGDLSLYGLTLHRPSRMTVMKRAGCCQCCEGCILL